LKPAAALRAYAALELIVAVCGLALPGTLAAVEPMFAAAYDNGQAAAGLVRAGAQSGRLDEAERILVLAQRADAQSLDVALAVAALCLAR
jgi:hypothetical protein